VRLQSNLSGCLVKKRGTCKKVEPLEYPDCYGRKYELEKPLAQMKRIRALGNRPNNRRWTALNRLTSSSRKAPIALPIKPAIVLKGCNNNELAAATLVGVGKRSHHLLRPPTAERGYGQAPGAMECPRGPQSGALGDDPLRAQRARSLRLQSWPGAWPTQ
jgi:hypothetical protein